MLRNRKVHYIDVSKMSEKELCTVLNIPYVPFYKSSFFWGMFILLALPALTDIIHLAMNL